MATCDYCHKNVDGLPHRCKYCSKIHCSNHLLPEDHDCKWTNKPKSKSWFKPRRIGHSELKGKPYVYSTHNSYSREYHRPRRRKFRFPKIKIKLGTWVFYLVFGILIFGLVSPFYLFSVSPPAQSMQYVIGNPKPIYLYDIGVSCANYENNIISSLEHLTEKTGVKFVRLESPLALLAGGISYNCESILSGVDVVGEAETGFVGVSWIIVAWNNIRLSSLSEEVIIHETLHVMGFGHSSNANSIMYDYTNGADIEKSLSNFIARYYTHKTSYLNIIPWNLLMVLVLIMMFISPRRRRF